MSTEPIEQSEPGPPTAATDPGTADRTLVGTGMSAVVAVVLWAWLGDDSFDSATATSLAWVLDNFGWLFVVAADVFLVLCLVTALSRFGRIRLGRDDSVPEFGNLAWIAMMFSAGRGIGLMFYGVGEPLTHYLVSPPASGVRARSDDAGAQPWSTRSSTGR